MKSISDVLNAFFLCQRETLASFPRKCRDNNLFLNKIIGKKEPFKIVGEKQKVLELDKRIMMCCKNIFVIRNEDFSYSFYKTDGSIVVGNVKDFLFYEGGALAVCNGDEDWALYREDGSLACPKADFYQVSDDGRLFATCLDDEYTIYQMDGTKLFEHLDGCWIDFSTCCMLHYPDGTKFMYNLDTKAKFALPENAHIIKLGCNDKFAIELDGVCSLYRVDGTKLLDGRLFYSCYENGLILTEGDEHFYCLLDADMKPILRGKWFDDVDGKGCLFRCENEKDYVFDLKGKLVATYPYGSAMVCGAGYYLLWDGKSNVVSLRRSDTSLVADGLKGAEVYSNGWKVLYYLCEVGDTEKHCVFYYRLLDDKDNVVVDNADIVIYLERFGSYIFAKDGKYSLVNAHGKFVVKDVDRIDVISDFYCIRRKEQPNEYRFLVHVND